MRRGKASESGCSRGLIPLLVCQRRVVQPVAVTAARPFACSTGRPRSGDSYGDSGGAEAGRSSAQATISRPSLLNRSLLPSITSNVARLLRYAPHWSCPPRRATSRRVQPDLAQSRSPPRRDARQLTSRCASHDRLSRRAPTMLLLDWGHRQAGDRPDRRGYPRGSSPPRPNAASRPRGVRAARSRRAGSPYGRSSQRRASQQSPP